MRDTIFTLSPHVRGILLCLSRALITEPPELVIRDKDAELLRRLEMVIREMPWLLRNFFLIALALFDRLTLFFRCGTVRFSQMSQAQQERYVQAWMKSRFRWCRDLYKGFRGLIMLCYFSHPDVWEYLDYHPHEHIEEKIQLRKKIIAGAS